MDEERDARRGPATGGKETSPDEIAGDVDARRLEEAARGLGRGAPDRPASGAGDRADKSERKGDRDVEGRAADSEC
jgi:hypothetical protein